MTSQLFETDRLQYLQLLGVQPYYRRSEVAQSGATEFRFSLDEDVLPLTEPEVVEQPAKVEVAAPQSLVAEKPLVSEPIAAPEARFAVDDKPNFQLWLTQFGSIAFLDSVPALLNDHQKQQNKRLLVNIARALKKTEFVAHHDIDWPKHTNLRSTSISSQDAYEYLQQRLLIAKVQQKFDYLVALGVTAGRFVAGEPDVQYGHQYKALGLPCLVTYSLTEMIRLPEVKAEVWQGLKQLLMASN